MDCGKVGALILRLRKEKGMTQKEVADKINISDKTVSKWERGLGCPDISLLGELSAVFGVNIESILTGSLDENEADGGNMKKVKFYACSECGNILTASGSAEISCCGRKLEPLGIKESDEKHNARVTEIEDELYIEPTHEMTKEHYITFGAYSDDNTVIIKKLYPEQDAAFRMPHYRSGYYYICCNRDGMYRLKN